MTTTTTLHPVDEFARAVRAALADLPADEVDDLTDGLEADLAERAADQESPEFGDPVAYAEELRNAAGLPHLRTRSSFAPFRDLTRATLRDTGRAIRSKPAAAAVIGFFVSLRPLWWFYRGWTVFLWFEFGLGSGIHPLPATIGGLLVFAPAIVVSVQLGRGRWLPWAWTRTVFALVNVALVVATPFIVGWLVTSSGHGYI